MANRTAAFVIGTERGVLDHWLMVLCDGAGGRDAQQLVPLLAHLQKHIVDPRHSNLFIGILNRVLDTYGPAVSTALPLLLLQSPVSIIVAVEVGAQV